MNPENHAIHPHIHSAEEKKAVVNRIARAIGHLEKVKWMVEQDADCSDVLIQLSAVSSAISKTGKVILLNHLNHCIVDAVKQNDYETVEKMLAALNKYMK